MFRTGTIMWTALFVLATLTAGPAIAEGEAESESLLDALASGTPSIDARLRYEHAEADDQDESDALTIRTRLGYTTAPYHGVSATVEFEDVSSLTDDDYNQAGLNPEGAGKTVIADVEGTELNQAYLDLTCPVTGVKARAGRQRIILGNARFIGNVGWRQNEQTYDAVRIDTPEMLDSLKLTYAYLDSVRRIFGQDNGSEPEGAAGNAATYDSDSHLVNMAITPCDHLTATAYAYLLDFGPGAVGEANSSDTYGINCAMGHTFDNGVKSGLQLEYARQADNDGTTAGVDYDADYIMADLSTGLKGIGLGVGYEQLGSDNGSQFRTPLATGHKYNGWADVFLTAPAEGLQDTYAYINLKCPKDFMPTIKIVYHDFESDEGGISYGDEIDVVATKKCNDRLTLIAKYANYQADDGADNPRASDVERISVQAGLTF
ncbi:MAG: alginate export family protein [Kiritimatiellae bacterium]|nr:alginate export family protein [Kiritimatiellia bacterium]